MNTHTVERMRDESWPPGTLFTWCDRAYIVARSRTVGAQRHIVCLDNGHKLPFEPHEDWERIDVAGAGGARMTDKLTDAIKQSLQDASDGLRQQAVTAWLVASAKYSYYSIQAACDANPNAASWYALVAIECGKMARDPSQELPTALVQEQARLLEPQQKEER